MCIFFGNESKRVTRIQAHLMGMFHAIDLSLLLLLTEMEGLDTISPSLQLL